MIHLYNRILWSIKNDDAALCWNKKCPSYMLKKIHCKPACRLWLLLLYALEKVRKVLHQHIFFNNFLGVVLKYIYHKIHPFQVHNSVVLVI